MSNLRAINLERPEAGKIPEQAALASILGRFRELVWETGKIAGKFGAGQELAASIKKIRNQLDALSRAPLPDPQICLFGEFSCGRTSFAEAFTGIHLAGIHEAYSGIPLKICPGDIEAISLVMANGHAIACPANELPAPNAQNETDVENIQEIIWQSPRMRAGITLVDAPGLGSLVKKHDESARKIAQNSDLILVLSNLAASPLSKKLLREVVAVAGPNAQNCVFFGTFADKFDRRDLEKLDSYFTKKLTTSFGHAPPHFFVSACKDFPTDQAGKTGKREDNRASFAEIRAQFMDLLDDARARKGIYRDCAEIEKILAEFMESAREFVTKYRQGGSDNNLLPDANPGSGDAEVVLANFMQASDATRKACEIAVTKMVNDFRQAITRRVNSFGDAESLMKYLGPDLDEDFANFDREFQTALQTALLKPMRKIAAECAKSLGQPRDMPPKTQISPNNPDIAIINFRPESMEDLEKRIGTDKKRELGGLGAGIAAALLVPGVGWLAGGLMAVSGFFLGSLFTPDIGDLKKDCLKQLAHTFNKLHNDAMLAVSINHAKIRAATLAELCKLRDYNANSKSLDEDAGRLFGEIVESLRHMDSLADDLRKIKQSLN